MGVRCAPPPHFARTPACAWGRRHFGWLAGWSTACSTFVTGSRGAEPALPAHGGYRTLA